MDEVTIKVGDSINGYEIVEIGKDPFVQGIINLWSNKFKTDDWGDKELVCFKLRHCEK